MKRSDFFIKLTTAVLLLAIAAYIGVFLYNTFLNVFDTTEAFSYTIEETLDSQGYIVRTETVLSEAGINAHPVVSEGERVAAGQVVAVEYFSREALATADEIRTLRLQIAQAEAQRNLGDIEGFGAIMDLSRAVNLRDFDRLDEISLTVEANIFMRDVDISQIHRRLEFLESQQLNARDITSPYSGTFSQVVDGFEHINPDMLSNLVPSELQSFFQSPTPSAGSGKVVTAFKWYYAAVMSNTDSAFLSIGDRRIVRFYGNFNAEIEMVVESLGRREDGYTVVLFSTDRGVHEITSLRSIRANIVANTITGIRVPREALHLDDDGTTYIFLQTAGFAERVDVEILEEAGDSFLVRDGIEAGTPLRVGSIIIVRANNLYHGRVVG
jgi:multidrug efflux pump subunit AcrA (membrane-fusion protein)